MTINLNVFVDIAAGKFSATVFLETNGVVRIHDAASVLADTVFAHIRREDKTENHLTKSYGEDEASTPSVADSFRARIVTPSRANDKAG